MTKQTKITPSGIELPKRTWLYHNIPFSVHLASNPVFFVTITVRNRNDSPLLPIAHALIDSARFYKNSGHWFPRLFLVMPDHIHSLVSVRESKKLADVIGNWKRYIAVTYGIQWEQGFFDTRIRNDEHLFERWDYILNNPVRKGLVPEPKSWKWRLAYDPQTGDERIPTGIKSV